MREFTIFQLCRESDGYQVYYDYKSDKLYECYTPAEETRPNYGILLIQPFLILGVEALGKWMTAWESWNRHLTWLLMLILSTIIVNVFWKKWIEHTEAIRNRRLRELLEPTEGEWESYLNLGRMQLKKQVHLYIWMGLATVGSAAVFLWNGFILFLLIYFVLYLILYPIFLVENPIRKYNLIKSRRKRK